jgi:pimeloyl-ACP methyl ester carboxylesterase
MGHLEYYWEFPVFQYDARGYGLSDWDVAEVSLESWVKDLETVVDAAGLRRFPLFGSRRDTLSQLIRRSHIERVSHLVLYGGYAAGRMKRPGIRDADRERYAAMKSLMPKRSGG